MDRLFSRRTLEKALERAGIQAEVSGRGEDVEVELPDEETKEKFQSLIANWGGYRTGYGGWVLRQHYKSKGDPGDPGSDWNYH